MSSGVEQQFSSSKDINDLDANVNNITFAERGVYNSGNVRSINTGDNARNIDARVYIEQYYTSSPPSIISILQNYAKALLTNYQLYWQQYVVLTSNEDNLANIPKPVGQIFDCPALEHELAKLRSVSQPSHTANPPRTEQLEDVEQHHNYGRVDDSSQNNQDKKVLLSEFTTLQDVVAKLRVYGMFAAGAVLIGEPGAGKTLSMRYFAVQQAQRAADSNEAIPIYLPLNAYRGETSLFDFVVHVFSADSTDPVFQQFADRLKEIASIRPLLLLLDGFNEIGDFSQGSDEQRKQFENILSDCLKYEPHVNFILSSREFVVPILPTAQGSIVVNLRPLDQFRISDYLRLYAPEYYIAILEELSTNASLQQLAANPFRAKALAYIYHPNRQLPSTPGTLFEQLVEQMIAREATKYHFQEVSWPLSVNWKNSIAKLAFNLQSNHKTAIDIKDPIINNVDSSDLQIAAICGVLQPVTHVVQFVHQQLQEYFAAQWLIQNNYQATSILNLPSNVLYDSYWDQTLLMLSNLISSEKLDGLVIQIACIDPFLAARCVGQSPGKVTLQVRVWLAAYFVRSLNEPTLSLSEMFEQILRALAEMNCSESFSQLASKDLLDQVCTRSKETINVYIDAVANFDHEAAAHFIIEEIYPAIVDKLSRYDTNPIVSALARMKTPYARNFLAVSLQDRKLYIDVLKAIGDYRIQGMDEQIREILESGNHLDEVLPAISKANLINLVSDLLPFAHENLAIMTVLIELGVGQVAIADYTKLQITLNRFYYNQRDYSEMGLDDYHNFQRAIKTFIAVEHTLGQTSAHQFTDLILYIAQNHQDYRTLHFALSVLVYLRHPTLQAVLERVERYLEEQLAPRSSQDNSFLVTPSSLHTFISFARRYLEFSGAPGFSQQRLERFCFALNSYSKQLINESIPQSISELVKLVYLEPQKIGHYAVLLLQSLNLHSNNYLERDARTYVVCLELLSDLNYTQIGNLIISGITQFLQRMRPREYGHNFRREIWRLAHVAVEYGQQNGRQRKEILDTVTSWLFVSNTLQQQVAVEICGRLNAYEYSAKWPLYLNDRTWITAYCIVDLLGRITVPEDVVQLLIKQLNLQQEDRRFFAALALGEIKAIDYIDDLVAIYSTSNQHVQWAIIWALGNIGKLTPSVIKLLHKAARSTFGRVRIEVANASAKLSAQELGSTLMALLDDSDLRVVERTVYALGCIRERAAIDQLLRLISQISSGRSHLSMFSAPYHVIERLEETLAVALVRLGVQVNDLEKPFEDVNPTLKAMCLSEAKRRTTSNTKFQRPTMYPPLLKLTSKSEMVERLYQLESMPVEDLLNQVTKADLPEERQKALEILYSTNFKGSVRAVETFSEDIHHRILYDPSRKVRQTFRENQFRKQYGRTLQFSLYTLKEDLDTARRTISIYPDLELHSIRMDERDAFSLYLARLFPEEYDNDILQSALSACLLTHDISHNEFAYLAARLPAEKLHLLFDYWRPNKFLGVERLSEPFSTSLMPLAYRKVWQIISDLVEALLNGEASAIVDATFYLCELGIHQAHELVALALTRIQAKKPDHSHYLEFLKMTAEVELLGININLPSTDFVIDMNDYEASHLWGLIANLLCEIDSSTPPQLWGSVQRRLLGYDDYFNHRFMTLTRGFYRWGISALMEVIAEDNQVVIHLLRRLPDLVHDNKKKWFRNEFEKIVYWIIQNRTQFPDSTFVNWLEEPFWPVRLFSAYILIGRKFPFTHTQIIKLFNDGNEHVVQGILSCAVNGPITGLHEILLQMSDSTQGEGRHLPEVEKVIEAILIYNLNSSDYECISIILSLLKEYQLPTLDKALISLSTRTPPNHLSEILDVMGQRLLLRPDNMLFRNRLQELLQGSDEDIISTSMSILLLAGDREIGSILWKHLQRPYYIPKAQISSSRDLDVDLPPYLGDKIDEDVAPDLGTFIDKGISKELIVNCLFGVALLQYKPAVEDIIRLLEHPEPEVQLAACATCAFLSLEKSLFALEYKIEHLQQIFQHPSTTDEYKSELEEKMQLLSSFISCRTILKQEGILKIGGGTIAIPLGSGIIGLLGCQLPFLLNSNETSLPLCSDRVLNLEFLRQMDPSGWRALALCQPQFLRRLIESDLQTSWLNKEDQQILIASFELMLAHLCQLTQVGGNYTNTSTLAAALQNFGVICHHAMDLVQIVEQIALVIKNNANKLIMQMEATVSNFAHSKDSSQFLRNSLNRLDNLTDGPMTWNQLQEFCEIEALYQYSFIKGVETYPLRKDLEESMTIFSLYDIVESRFLLGEIEGTPDIEFWAHFNHFGRFFNSHNLLYEWGLTTIAVLQQISQQSNLGSTYSHEWPKYRSYLIPRLNNNQDVMVNNPTKANPLEKLFIRFEMPSLD